MKYPNPGRRFSALLLLVGLGLGAANAKDADVGYAIIHGGAVAMEKFSIKRGNGYPWLPDVLFWSCGFARITYEEADTVAFLAGDDNFSTKHSSFYYLMGEWCEVADALMEGGRPHVIGYRSWRGKKYLLTRAVVYTDNDGTAYVADKSFVEWNELQSLVQPIAQGEDNGGCFDPAYELPELLDDRSSLVTVRDYLCATKGVRLKDFMLPAGKRPR